MSSPDRDAVETPEYVEATSLWWLKRQAIALPFLVAAMLPIWLQSKFRFLRDDMGENEMWWAVFAFVGWYTLLAATAAAAYLRMAWLTLKHGSPYPGALVSRRTRVRRGVHAGLAAAFHAAFGLLILFGVGYAWAAMQLPAALFGIGEDADDSRSPCP
jgi:hypothetical protein